MTRGYVPLISLLAAVWGASYLFIKVAVDDVEPAPMMFARVALAALLLVPFVLFTRGVRIGLGELRAAALPGLVLGAINAAIPFTLIAWGEKHIDSGVAAVANATVPLFVVLLAIRYRPSERARGARLAGILLGLAGVALLAGAQPEGGWWTVAGTLAVVVASLSYGIGALYGQGLSGQVAGPVLAAAATVGAALVLAPLAVVQAPHDLPGWKAIASIVALGVGGTALAQLVLYRMLRLYGASRTTLVTYLMPPTALVYGLVLLGESLTVASVGGLVVILLGVALGSGAVRLPRRGPEPEPAAPPA
jgi:drug/metabolite transporter (DMT)-like permease